MDAPLPPGGGGDAVAADADAAPADHLTPAEVSMDVDSAPLSAPRGSFREFLRLTATQQTLLVFVGSIGYDAGSIAYLFNALLAASIFFMVASAGFVLGLGMDIIEIRDVKREALEFKECEPDVYNALTKNRWRRWLAFVFNTGGGVASFLGSVSYLRASFQIVDITGQERVLHKGDMQFAIGMWLFVTGMALITYDIRSTLVTVARIRGAPIPPFDSTLYVLIAYDLCLVIFGIASTLYVLPDNTSQTVGTGLFVVSDVSFTSMNAVALWFLWKEHSRGEKTEEGEAEEGEAAEEEAEAADEPAAGPEAASVEGWHEPAADAGAGAGPRHSATHRPDMREIYVVMGLLGHSRRHSHPDVLGAEPGAEGGKGSPATHTRRAALAKSSFGQ